MYLWNKIRSTNFIRLYAAVFLSEFGGYLTNTVILIHLFKETGGSKFWLGLSQILFVGPLALGTILGGSIGENYNRRKIMILCELSNLILVLGLLYSNQVISIILFRAVIVFFAGVYNPSRQAMVQEIVDQKHLHSANAAFATAYAILHSVGPMAGAFAYKYFGGVQEVFITNMVTYLLGASLLYQIHYTSRSHALSAIDFREVFRGIMDGFFHVRSRADLNALLRNFSVGGICLGIFYPTLLPFIAETFHGDETLYGKLLLAFGIGGIIGGGCSPLLLKVMRKGRVLVSLALLQAILFLVWTQMRNIYFSYTIIFLWGWGMMSIVTAYVNYIQVNVSSQFQSRAFSLYDQATSLSVVLGAGVVLLVGDKISATHLLTYTAIGTLALVLVQLMSVGVRTLFNMET